MATEYRDGTFGETLPFTEAMPKFLEACDAGLARAFHVGTDEEIEAVKKQKALEAELDKLNERVKELEAKNSETIITPDLKDFERFIKTNLRGDEDGVKF